MSNKIVNVVKALLLSVSDQASILGGAFVGPMAKRYVSGLLPTASSKWAVGNLLTEKAVDGAILSGVVPSTAWAKYTLPKGLPKPGQRFLAIENEPHLVDDFDGVIASGYGKGTKTLLFSGRVPVKVGLKTFLGKVNIHLHEADKAGPHYDIVVEGVRTGTPQWEINIPNGDFKGRFAFVSTDKGTIVVPMLDRGIVLPKPSYKLKPVNFLEKVKNDNRAAVEAGNPPPYIVEWKPDGSLANVEIGDYRAVLRSHRETASSYYDKLPDIEHLRNTSHFLLSRLLFLYPDQVGTLLRAELVHPDGIQRVSGILNSSALKAQQTQLIRGPVRLFAWDLVKLRGEDVSGLPAGERRRLLEEVISEIRLFNKNWDIVPSVTGKQDPISFYERIVTDPRGMPYAEGVVVKDALTNNGWWKIKSSDPVDLEILPDGFIQGTYGVTGKYSDSLGSLRCRDVVTGKTVTVGTGFSDAERDWIWQHKEDLAGAVIKAEVFAPTATSFRAARFQSFHESKGDNEAGLKMYAETLAGMNPIEAEEIRYRLKSAAGWRGK